MTTCPTCDHPIKFSVRSRAKQVICNVYEQGQWLRVEHYHEHCYDEAGSPYGTADDSQPFRQRRRTVPAA